MVTRNEYFITQTKLRELPEQRGKLLAAYDALSQRAAQQQDEAGRLRALYSGLQQIKFANYALHPDVANLEPLLQEAESGQASLETISFWRARLEKELLHGRLRAEMVYIFGALSEEWALQQASARASETNDEETRRLLAQQTGAPTETGAYDALLDPLFSAPGFSDAPPIEHLRAALADRLPTPTAAAELTIILEGLAADPYRSAAFRSQAQSLLLDKVLLKELADALTILLQHVDEWDWPGAGVPVEARLTPNKWRLFLDDELPQACFLEVLGARWRDCFADFFKQRQHARLKYLRRVQRETGPDAAGEAGAEQGNVTAGLGRLGEVDIWAEASGSSLKEQMSRWVEYHTADYRSVFQQRWREREQLHWLSSQVGYQAQETITGLERALMLINAEIQLGRAAFPERPLYVLKVDLKDFYPSLSHDLLLTILRRCKLSDAQPKAVVPEDRLSTWQKEAYEWRTFYSAFFQEVKLQAPAPNQVMETLVKDFIERGAELSVGKQKDLSPYWRWVLYISGPQILEHLGTFRFLITELVPLQLVGRRQVGDEQESSADDDKIPF
jgi:hypothetical protein